MKYKLKQYTRDEMEHLAYIAKNLRYYTKYWHKHFGSNNRLQMKRWEDKMDIWLYNNLEEDKEE